MIPQMCPSLRGFTPSLEGDIVAPRGAAEARKHLGTLRAPGCRLCCGEALDLGAPGFCRVMLRGETACGTPRLRGPHCSQIAPRDSQWENDVDTGEEKVPEHEAPGLSKPRGPGLGKYSMRLMGPGGSQGHWTGKVNTSQPGPDLSTSFPCLPFQPLFLPASWHSTFGRVCHALSTSSHLLC